MNYIKLAIMAGLAALLLTVGARLDAWYQHAACAREMAPLQAQIADYADAKAKGEADAREEQRKADADNAADLKAKNDAAAQSVTEALAQNERLVSENARIQRALNEARKNDIQSKNWLNAPVPAAVRAAYGLLSASQTGPSPAASGGH